MPMSPAKVASLSLFCCEATGAVLESSCSVDGSLGVEGEIQWSRWIDSLCRSVDSPGLSWLAIPSYPIGEYHPHWAGGLHDDDDDGHGLRDEPKNFEGDRVLQGELSALNIQAGLEYATDDVRMHIWSLPQRMKPERPR